MRTFKVGLLLIINHTVAAMDTHEFMLAFNNQDIVTVQHVLLTIPEYRDLVDSQTGDSLAQQAVQQKKGNISFLKMVMRYTNFNHRNMYAERFEDTVMRMYRSSKLSKETSDRILHEYKKITVMVQQGPSIGTEARENLS